MASVLPARGVSRYPRAFIRLARSNSCSISLRLKSVIWRKSRFAKSSPPDPLPHWRGGTSVKMTGLCVGFYPGAPGRTRLRLERLPRQDDFDSCPSAEGLVGREPVLGGDPGEVADKRVDGLIELDDVPRQRP